MDLLHLIDRLEEQIGEARRLPIGTGSVIDRRRLLDLVDQLRAAVPAEVREATDVLRAREDVLARADQEAAVRLSRAEEEVSRRVNESEIARAAQARAEEIIADARRTAEQIVDEARRRAEEQTQHGARLASEQMDEADRYAVEMLRKLEQQLDAFMGSVRSGLHSLEQQPGDQPVSAASPFPEPAERRN